MKHAITVFAWDNGRGLSRDLAVILPVMQGLGINVTVAPIRRHERGAYQRAQIRRHFRRPKRDVNIFLESLVPSEFHLARHNVLIPNQEWFELDDLRFLKLLDVIACRSHLGSARFANHGAVVEYIGFTSADRKVEGVAKGERIIHVAGHSLFKGTDALVRVWRRHPEWPTLTIVHRTTSAAAFRAANIDHRFEHVPEEELRRMQQEAWLHIQPSQAEGFGHCLCEAMSSAAVVVTVDAPPMNEIVTTARGILVPWQESEPMGVDRRYFVDEDALERMLARLLGASRPEGLMAAARAWYQSNDTRFKESFAGFVERLVGEPPGGSIR